VIALAKSPSAVLAAADLSVVALVKQSALADFGLVPGVPVTVLVKAHDIILTVAS
jgi:hypothetical protein